MHFNSTTINRCVVFKLSRTQIHILLKINYGTFIQTLQQVRVELFAAQAYFTTEKSGSYPQTITN